MAAGHSREEAAGGAESPGLFASGKFRLRAGSLSRTLLGNKSFNSSRASLDDVRGDDASLTSPTSSTSAMSGSSADSFSNHAPGSLPDRFRRMSTSTTTSSVTSSSDSRFHQRRRGSSASSSASQVAAGPSSPPRLSNTTTRPPPAAPSASYRRQGRGSWNREPLTQDEHVAQRLRALPRLASYSSTTTAEQPRAMRPHSPVLPAEESNPFDFTQPAPYSMTDVSDSGFGSSTELESEDDDLDHHHEDVDESDLEQHSSPETEDSSPFFGHSTTASTPNTSPDSVGPSAQTQTQQQQQQQQQLDQSLSSSSSSQTWKSWSGAAAANPTQTPTTARPTAEAGIGSYFDSRPRPTDPAGSPRDTLRTPTASRPTSSHQHQQQQRRSHGTRSSSLDPSFPLLSPRLEAGEMLEREARELRDKLKTTQQFQLRQPPSAHEDKSLHSHRAATTAASSSSGHSKGSDARPAPSTAAQPSANPPSYDPGPPEARLPYSAVRPRDDEGAESLPGYSCDVHIEGWMPRKCEFTMMGVPSTSRAWKRQYIVLHGTSLRILNGDPSVKHGRHVAPSARRPSQSDALPPARPSRSSTPDVVTSKRRQSKSTAAGTGASEAPRSVGPAKLAGDEADEEGAGAGSVTLHTSGKVYGSGTRNPFVHEGHYDGAKSSLPATLATKVLSKENPDVLKHYTLQGAESGLAVDYTKRQYCIRIRAEGEQFLIQAADERGVIDWVEALQAATNIALDLDRRPLPKFITLPRRRRRRRVIADQNGRELNTQQQQQHTSDANPMPAPESASRSADIMEETRREATLM